MKLRFYWLEHLAAIILSIGFLLLLNGCSSNDRSAPSQDGNGKDKIICTVGNSSIYGKQFKERFSTYVSDEKQLKKNLDDMVTEELLFQEAMRKDLVNDPEIKKQIRKIVTQKLLEREVSEKSWNREISKEEIQAYYDKNEHEFNRPEQIRLADIFIAVPENANTAQKNALKEKAGKVLSKALATQKTRSGFLNLIENDSDTPARYRRGDTGFIDREGSHQGVAPKVVEAGFTLKKNGEIYREVIEAGDGYHVVMKIGEKTAAHIPLEQIRKKLENQLRRDEVYEKQVLFIAQLNKKGRIHIDEKVFAEIASELTQQFAQVPSEKQHAGSFSPGQ